MRNGIAYSDEELLKLVTQLSSAGLIRLQKQAAAVSFLRYLTDYDHAFWLYLLLLVPLGETFLVILPTQELVLAALREILGLALLGFLPGYAIIAMLFPAKEIKTLERIILSIFLSVVTSISAGVILGSFLLFQPVWNVLSLSLFTIITAVGAGYRTFNIQSKAGRRIRLDET